MDSGLLYPSTLQPVSALTPNEKGHLSTQKGQFQHSGFTERLNSCILVLYRKNLFVRNTFKDSAVSATKSRITLLLTN